MTTVTVNIHTLNTLVKLAKSYAAQRHGMEDAYTDAGRDGAEALRAHGFPAWTDADDGGSNVVVLSSTHPLGERR